MVKSYFEAINQHSEKNEENHKFFAQDSCLSSKIWNGYLVNKSIEVYCFSELLNWSSTFHSFWQPIFIPILLANVYYRYISNFHV